MTRPHVEARIVGPEALENETERFDPHLVICSPPIPSDPVADRLAWIELSPHPDKPSRVRVEERYWETENLTLEALLAVVDEVEGMTDETTSEPERA